MKTRGSSAATVLFLLLCGAAGSNSASHGFAKSKRSPEIRANPDKVILEELVIGKNREIQGCAIAEDASKVNDQILALLTGQEKKNSMMQADQSVIVNLSDVNDLGNLERELAVIDYEPQKLTGRKKKRRTVSVSDEFSDPNTANAESLKNHATQDYEVQKNPHLRTKAPVQDPVAVKLYSRLPQRNAEPTAPDELSVIKKRGKYATAKTTDYTDATTAPVKKHRRKPSKIRSQLDSENSQPLSETQRARQPYEPAFPTSDTRLPQPTKRRTRKRVGSPEKPGTAENLSSGNLQTSYTDEHQDNFERLRPLEKYNVQPRPFALREKHRDVPLVPATVGKVYKGEGIGEENKRGVLEPVDFIEGSRYSKGDSRFVEEDSVEAPVQVGQDTKHWVLEEERIDPESTLVNNGGSEAESRDSSDSHRNVKPSTVSSESSHPRFTPASHATPSLYSTDGVISPSIIASKDHRRFDAYARTDEPMQPIETLEPIMITDRDTDAGTPSDHSHKRNESQESEAEDGTPDESSIGENKYRDERNAEGGSGELYSSESSREVDEAGQGDQDGEHRGEVQAASGTKQSEGKMGDAGGGDQEFEKGGGADHGEEHRETEGEKGEKGYNSWHEDTESNKGHHDKERRNNYYGEEDKKKKESDEEGGYHEEYSEGEQAEKDAKFGEKGEHQKGHSTKGQHFIHKKDEFEKKTEFFDEYNEDGDAEKDGEFYHEHEASKGGHEKSSHHAEDHLEGKYGEERDHEKGGHYHEHKGHDLTEGHEDYFDHEDGHGEKAGHQEGKKWGYKRAETGGDKGGDKSDR